MPKCEYVCERVFVCFHAARVYPFIANFAAVVFCYTLYLIAGSPLHAKKRAEITTAVASLSEITLRKNKKY